MNDILTLLREHPELQKLNAGFECNEGLEKSLREDAKIERSNPS